MTLRDLMVFTIGFGLAWSIAHRRKLPRKLPRIIRLRRPWPVAERMN